MDKRRPVRSTVYTLVVLNFISILALVVLSRLLTWTLLLACGLPVFLCLDYLFLRWKLKINRPVIQPGELKPGGRPHSLYIGSAFHFAGTLLGLALVCGGALPWTLLPFLLIPLSLGFYSLRTARKVLRQSKVTR